MNDITPIKTAPACLLPLAQKINAVIKALRPLLNIEGRGDVEIARSKTNVNVIVHSRTPRSDLPPGYEELTVTLCTPTEPDHPPVPPRTGKLLFKRAT